MRKIAVIGGGAAGMTAAYLLSEAHDVTLFEQAARLGGHACTVTLPDGPDAGTPLDVGFMVLNDGTYPSLHRLLARLGGIRFKESEMSFGYQSADGETQYSLNWRPGYVANQQPRLPDPALLREILRCFRLGSRDLAAGLPPELAYGDYLASRGFSRAFIDTYAIPMGAALWSSAPAHVLASPAAFVLGFYAHHGMLSLDEGPRWQTIDGGSRTYVDRIAMALGDRLHLNAPPLTLTRHEDHVELSIDGHPHRYDDVVLATQADQALALLSDPDEQETRSLSPWRYQSSRAVLHADPGVMPRDQAAWSSWNYVQERPHAECDGPTLTYHLDRLQGLAVSRPYFLTLNPTRELDAIQAFDFRHPVYTPAAVANRPTSRRRTHFCGNYLGSGFHEDAVRAGADVAAAFGVTL